MSTVSLTLADRALAVSANTGATVLEAALAAGLPFPHSCQAGNCGTCKCELLAGEVLELPYSEFALSAAERERGLILACRTQLWGDAAVRGLTEEDLVQHPSRDLRCRVSTLSRLTHDIVQVRLAVEAGGPFFFSAGQYARLEFANGVARDYSMANPAPMNPAAGEALEFHIRQTPGGQASNYVADKLHVGAVVRVTGPFGSAYLREAHRGPIVALAGGSGMAPVRCILTRALALDPARPIRLYFGVRDERDIYLESELQALARQHRNFHYDIVLSEPASPTARRRGFLHQALAADAPALDGAKVYLAGPPLMVEAATVQLRARGVAERDLHADAFYTEAERVARAAA
jgi:CDP-4-dehydro-6-deoxyglucose reductase/ferredoxin-NAD(P)+ reductase (naphthalene dioxygenase ferredoxin-specific)